MVPLRQCDSCSHPSLHARFLGSFGRPRCQRLCLCRACSRLAVQIRDRFRLRLARARHLIGWFNSSNAPYLVLPRMVPAGRAGLAPTPCFTHASLLQRPSMGESSAPAQYKTASPPSPPCPGRRSLLIRRNRDQIFCCSLGHCGLSLHSNVSPPDSCLYDLNLLCFCWSPPA